MKVLFATDGSSSAERACSLIGSLPWPAGTRLRLMTAAERVPSALDVPPGAAETVQRDLRHELGEMLHRAGRAIETPAVSVDEVVVEGAPADAIVDEARRFGADLVVVGNRGHGPIATVLLGSVADAVASRAPCAVLVARTERIRRIVLADDGSPTARHAAELIASWPIFEACPVRVVSVVHVAVPLGSGIAPTMHDAVLRSYQHNLVEERDEHRAMAEACVRRLAAAGLAADCEVRSGDAAEQIIAVARDAGADLIALGSRGRSGIGRALLGSVARDVLQHSHASVLVVRR